MKTKHLFLTLSFCLISTFSFSQNTNIARAYYIKAKEAFADNQYGNAIDYLEKAENELGNTNPDIIYLELMSRYNLDKRDPDINNLAMEFMDAASPQDDRTQKVSLIAVEHKELLEAEREKERRAFRLAESSESLQNLRAYLKEYPDTPNSIEVKKMLADKEREDFLKAKNTNTVFALELYRRDYPNGEYSNEVMDLLTIAREEELYKRAMRENDIQLFNSYLITYPDGKYNQQVKASLEAAILGKADKEYNDKDYARARNTYEKYQEKFPSGSKTTLVEQRISEIEKRIERKARLDSRTSANYFMATYSTQELYGIQLGKLSLNKVGTYFNLSVNENVGNLTFTAENETTSLAEDFEQASISAGFGLTYKITYPLWVYVGGGAIYTDYYLENEDGEVNTFKLEGVDNYQFYPELGFNVKLGRVGALKAGASYINGEMFWNVGLGFQTKNW